MSEDTKEMVRRFIVREVLDEPEETSLPTDVPLIDVLDSFGLMQLLFFIEEHYELRVGNHEVVNENFGSLDAVVAFIERKRGAAA